MFEYLMKWIEEKDNVYVIGMGDYIEATHPQMPWFDINDIQETVLDEKLPKINRNLLTMGEQFKKVKKYFTPLVDQGKVIGMHEGNHDIRMATVTGYNMVAEMCAELGVKYLGHSALTRLAFVSGKKPHEVVNSWDIFSTHGKGGGITSGGRINKLEKLPRMYEADIYLHGDLHSLISSRDQIVKMNREGNLENKSRIMTHTGSFVKSVIEGHITYSERKDYSPLQTGCPKITFLPHDKVIKLSTYDSENWKEWD